MRQLDARKLNYIEIHKAKISFSKLSLWDRLRILFGLKNIHIKGYLKIENIEKGFADCKY